jgi:hypothetical protein
MFLEVVLRATNELQLYKKLSYCLLQSIQGMQSMDGNPIFAILHEPIYCQGWVNTSELFLKFHFIALLDKLPIGLPTAF